MEESDFDKQATWQGRQLIEQRYDVTYIDINETSYNLRDDISPIDVFDDKNKAGDTLVDDQNERLFDVYSRFENAQPFLNRLIRSNSVRINV